MIWLWVDQGDNRLSCFGFDRLFGRRNEELARFGDRELQEVDRDGGS